MEAETPAGMVMADLEADTAAPVDHPAPEGPMRQSQVEHYFHENLNCM